MYVASSNRDIPGFSELGRAPVRPILPGFDRCDALLAALPAFHTFRCQWNVISALALSVTGLLVLGQIA